MKVVKPSHNILIHEDNPLKHIEKIGRICYKSEDSITENSSVGFVKRLFKNNHHAMLEHFRFIIVVEDYIYYRLMSDLSINKYNNSVVTKYITFTNFNNRYVMSASSRGLNDLFMANIGTSINNCLMKDCLSKVIKHILYEYPNSEVMFNDEVIEFVNKFGVLDDQCRIIKDFDELSKDEYKYHAWYSVHFICDRGVSHELVRHRDASFAQESTRYCNYSNGKFGSEITVIEPFFWDKDSSEYKLWWLDCKHSEETYNSLIRAGAVPQEARTVLPNSLKTEIVITAQMYEWDHMFDLRVLGKTGAPHPQMKESMEPLYIEMKSNNLV